MSFLFQPSQDQSNSTSTPKEPVTINKCTNTSRHTPYFPSGKTNCCSQYSLTTFQQLRFENPKTYSSKKRSTELYTACYVCKHIINETNCTGQ